MAILAAVFGLAVGSFLNAVIHRLHAGESFMSGRSKCPHCHLNLSAWDLVPILSFLVLKGKCAYCGKPISWQYPAVEALTAVTFALAATAYSGPEMIFVWGLSAFFILIAVYDLKHFLILDKVLYPGFVLSVAYALYQDIGKGCDFGLGCATISGLVGILFIAGFFYLQHLVSKGKWIGFGDVKFGLMLGMAAGFPLSILLLFGAYLSGALVGLALIALGKKQMGSRLPFGTFLAASAIVTMLYGQSIMSWYLELIGFSSL